MTAYFSTLQRRLGNPSPAYPSSTLWYRSYTQRVVLRDEPRLLVAVLSMAVVALITKVSLLKVICPARSLSATSVVSVCANLGRRIVRRGVVRAACWEGGIDLRDDVATSASMRCCLHRADERWCD